MATALDLQSFNTIINGQGLATSANLLAEIATFHAQPTVTLIANISATVSNTNPNVAANLVPVLSNIGNAAQGQWLLDLYPSNISPSATANVYYYLEQPNVYINPVTFVETVTYTPVPSSASFTYTLKNQAESYFAYGLQEFANIFQTAYAYAGGNFDTISSVTLLDNRTYGQSGVGYTGPLDLATAGLGALAPVIANVVSKFGTMYDIKNIGTFADPYVFGQNLLNQGLGAYGNLSANLSSAGLNINNLPQVPLNSTSTTQSIVNTTLPSAIGNISLPAIQSTTVTVTVTGTSANVVTNIYSQIVGNDLASIQSATNVTVPNSNTISTLNDFLDIDKVLYPADIASLSSAGIATLTDLSKFIQSKVGTGYYTSWQDLATVLNNLEIPALNYTSTTANTAAVSSAVVAEVYNQFGSGSGPFKNIVLSDIIGSVAGIPYTQDLTVINSQYAASEGPLYSAVADLDAKVVDYVNGGATTITDIQTSVANVNSTLNSLANTSAFYASEQAYYNILNSLSAEVSNISRAGISFNSGNYAQLKSLAQRYGTLASDKTQTLTYQFFANVETNDASGDVLRATVAEKINNNILSSKGVTNYNDPNPSALLRQSQNQNIPITTYITHNK